MELAEIKKDLTKYLEKSKKAGYLEFKRELVSELLPALMAFIDSCEERFVETEEQVAAVLDDMDLTDSIIQPALAAQLIGTLELGVQLTQAVAELQLDEVTKQRLAILVDAYVKAQELARKTINELAVEEDGDDDPDEPADHPDDGIPAVETAIHTSEKSS